MTSETVVPETAKTTPEGWWIQQNAAVVIATANDYQVQKVLDFGCRQQRKKGPRQICQCCKMKLKASEKACNGELETQDESLLERAPKTISTAAKG